MKNFRETLKEQLKNPKFKKEFDDLEPEYQIIREMMKAREEKNITQVELSKLTGISQTDISRLKNKKKIIIYEFTFICFPLYKISLIDIR